MLVKDRWVSPHEQVLNISIVYWYMGPVSLVAYHQQKLALSLLLHWLAWERNWVRPHGSSAGVLWIVSGALFLRSSGIRPNLFVACEMLLYVDHVRYVWSMVICGLSVESGWRVGRVFPCRVYIDLNYRDSQI
jgi:hypothetical protein